MKFLRFLENNKIKIGYFDGKKVVELSDSIESLLINCHNWKYVAKKVQMSYSLDDIQFLPPIVPSKIICIGLNYKDHAKELNMEIPQEPRIFLKPPSAIIAHNDSIKYPEMSDEVDYEAELAIVVSKDGKNIGIEEAHEYIGGYTILNDVTARDIQRKDEQWTRAKSFDTFCPIGPVIETEMDSKNQNISLTLNGETKQNSNTKNMIFSSAELIEFISNIMTLNSGDIISTGTPPGVGQMKRGDIVKINIEDIGTLSNQLI
ncbi:ureidoglycolate lyase [Methanobrevibacter cuticularis]|uniref:Ureidoglycolate lyase n=1 Tax=Methanobrevibacter cuticularis TaxID=47311 RepID=A0A166EC20_9EURY|nr:fumarylacetoacetate hydrolase family protein [Methanobrevibacter cuticularis]KZX16492.1 ureidoglycolate lyase [Methanobrevibacter cuticularis]